MAFSLSRALVPLTSRLPERWTRWAEPARLPPPYRGPVAAQLVQEETYLKNRAQVERRLPDILGRALARIWIDPGFRVRFGDDPKGTLADYGVHLPDTIEVEFETAGLRRPQVVVYEQLGARDTRKRLLYLQLVMVAGR